MVSIRTMFSCCETIASLLQQQHLFMGRKQMLIMVQQSRDQRPAEET